MPSGTIETYEGCVDLVTGLLFMGTGSGGSPEGGMAMAGPRYFGFDIEYQAIEELV